MKKNIKYIIISIIFGIMLGKYIFNEYKEDTKVVINQTSDTVYLMQYGVYKDENNMKKASKDLKNYFYYKDSDGYHVLIGITKNKKNKQKIVESYEILTNIYMKKVKIDNEEFLELLNQYDSLIEQTNDKEIINNAQKQILSKYEELILNSE